ncbi:MAG: ABC transporter substrate-binding protein [Proteobacteria bacterium]|nr:ABC transporter substrate-binding protein [Pseudomonadota bacterium]
MLNPVRTRWLLRSAFFTLTTLLATASIAETAPTGAEAAPPATEHPAMMAMRVLVDDVQQNLKLTLEDPSRREELTERNFELISGAVHWNSFFKLVFGRQWKPLSESQREQLSQRLRQLIARVYVRALDQYSNYKFDFIRVQPSPRPNIVSVEMKVIPPDGSKATSVHSRMILIEDQWLSFDFLVNNLSISSAYKSNYRSALKKNGFDELIALMDAAITRHAEAEEAKAKENSDASIESDTGSPESPGTAPAGEAP